MALASSAMDSQQVEVTERQDWHRLSEPSLRVLWDNECDAIYDDGRALYTALPRTTPASPSTVTADADAVPGWLLEHLGAMQP